MFHLLVSVKLLGSPTTTLSRNKTEFVFGRLTDTYSVINGIISQIKGNTETELEKAHQTIIQITNHSD